ncbi:class II aldolase/adducin family protein [Alkalimarinus sediminis]|uniref:Class II aldolase/adducin family protein n=1 Tax=Alkalimarinus sediminis TaxID=1632866 RepID=A0A9E8KR58_9ALTE|nr:class II aldolase/adducin family protein [Alkalimarinus sediminis]UZW75652.1 class II aldolase/adducin family protein [Alkalimarinus sediminis]
MVNQGLKVKDQAGGREVEREGVIKYQLSFVHQPIPSRISVASLDKWRHVLFNLALIGQDSKRYEGLGFGNISHRISDVTVNSFVEHDGVLVSGAAENSFLISGSQTGHLPFLKHEHCSVVTHCDPALNQLVGYGETKPSSESLTHGALYNHMPEIAAVVHVHSPTIWNLVDELGLPATKSNIPYGTPDMADAVTNVATQILANGVEPVFVMKGHVDGVVAFGPDLASAVTALFRVYHRAVMKTVR